MSKYKIIETKVRTVEINDTLTLTIPFDLEITDEWLDDQMFNIPLSKCVNYLENLGFILKDNKWCYYKEESINVILENYFIDMKNSKLLVEFGEIRNCGRFKFPQILKGYCSLKEFPTFPNSNPSIYISLDLWDEYSSERLIDSFILTIYSDYLIEKKNMKDVNSLLYLRLSKFIDIKHEDLCKYYLDNKLILEKDPIFKKIFKSNEIINKFNL